MLKSVAETRKLFRIEAFEGGRVDVEASSYLLSLPANQQAEVLSKQAKMLREDLEKYNAVPTETLEKADQVEKAQLQLLIQVIEGLLAEI